MDILPFLGSLFSKTDNIAILVLVLMLGLMVWMNRQQRLEDREDRKATVDALGKVAEALNGVKLALELLKAKVE